MRIPADSINAAVALTGNETWTINSGDSLTVSGNISGSGYGLTESGGGTLKLGGTQQLQRRHHSEQRCYW